MKVHQRNPVPLLLPLLPAGARDAALQTADERQDQPIPDQISAQAGP